MLERRKIHRRHYEQFTTFPLYSRKGDLVISERRKLPTRRVNDIYVEELACDDIHKYFR